MTLKAQARPPLRAPFRANKVGSATFTIGAETSNAIRVSIQLLDERRRELTERAAVTVFLSDDANGDSITGTPAAGGIAGGTDGWFLSLVAGRYGQAMSEADGDIDIDVTHATGARTWFLGVILPDGGRVMSGPLAFV